jgi:hypothetical protein
MYLYVREVWRGEKDAASPSLILLAGGKDNADLCDGRR